MVKQTRVYGWTMGGITFGVVAAMAAIVGSIPLQDAVTPAVAASTTAPTTVVSTNSTLLRVAAANVKPCGYHGACPGPTTTTTTAPTTTTTTTAPTTTAPTTTAPTTTTILVPDGTCLVTWEKKNGTITDSRTPRGSIQVTETLDLEFTVTGCEAASIDHFSFVPGTPTPKQFVLTCATDGPARAKIGQSFTIRDSSGNVLPHVLSSGTSRITRFYTLYDPNSTDRWQSCRDLADSLL